MSDVSAVRDSIVRASGVSQHYGTTVALQGVTLDVPAGLMVGILGPDGVGKSTLLDLIAGARKLQSGELEVLGGDIRSASHRRVLGPRLAYMPQGLGKNLYHSLSVRENLDFFGRLFALDTADRAAQIERLTRATGLLPFLDRPAGKLSGGMKQKLGLCCSLLHDPDLLILDEPTTGVDPLSRGQFWDLIADIRKGRPNMSVLVSTAYMDEADGFDWLVAMADGRILDTGTPEELRHKTDAADLETAFVRLLPENRRGSGVELDIPPLVADGEAPAIVARGLTKRFGDFTALRDVSFEIRPGEIFGFLGSNGCGKTTTMKMLTGLLPITEGEAELMGRPVDASDIATRKRVGFMSQAFSLYGELTVQQNLALHARLFDLPRDHAKRRIEEVVELFDLAPIRNEKSGDLPLGMRQRLSLAVAVLHEPEVLILDEPTSGVDPVARDQFWDLLVHLSREKKVTIFISTHFMNEALRCDRISLMHAGQVLVYDEPKRLADQSESGRLEETFIHYIEDAIAKQGGSEQPESADLLLGNAAQHAGSKASGFSIGRLLAISYREMKDLSRDPIRVAFASLGSVFLLLVIAMGISMDVDNITTAVLDEDQTPESRAYMDAFFASSYFTESAQLASHDDLMSRLRSGNISVGVEIPRGFGRDVRDDRTVDVAANIDGANTQRAGTVESYVTGAHAQYLQDLLRGQGFDPDELSTYGFESRYRYNPTFESLNAIGPAVPPIMLLLIPAILMALSVAREREIGTITNFYVTPTTKLEFLLGKQLPYIAVTMVNFALLMLVVVLVLGVPMTGDFLPFAIGALFYAIVATAYGLMISAAVKTQVAAVFAASILSMMPSVQFSGLIQPISTLSDAGQAIGTFWPASYFVHLSTGAFTKGLGWEEMLPSLLALVAFVPAFMLPAYLLLRKQAA
ncbi:ribosome-associated ATPase/putative transporter RbbA [Pseudoruegeria sp. HB172150]|uniref:ribosome-associated ATPase/putative transporter RbbA n=1 Tax=Pseudoruegeria sp. HB172150 TaxID=2721164 RepID=UPI0015551FA1|nr:ribosome-associated ATPase/putative transporter RbbA [Pseudoruegeria sp. HB172150]